MKEAWSVLVEDADQNESEIKDLESLGYERYDLPDNLVLMVDEDAPDEIKNAAMEAQNGDYDAYLIAMGLDDEDLTDDEEVELLK